MWKFLPPSDLFMPFLTAFQAFKSGIKISTGSGNIIHMNSTAENLSDENVFVFFRKLKTELNCSSNLKLIEQVRQVLSKVKNFGTLEIMKRMPPLFRLIVYPVKVHDNSVNHLDELAESVFKDNKKCGLKLFKSEIDALDVAIVILNRTQELFKAIGVQALPPSLSNEINHAISTEPL